MLEAGTTTPCRPVSPACRHTSKNPSTFSLTPPIAWMRPCWLTEPVIATPWRIGASASAESSTMSSAADAESPSIAS